MRTSLIFLEASFTYFYNRPPGLWRWTSGLPKSGPRDHHPSLGLRVHPGKSLLVQKQNWFQQLVLQRVWLHHPQGSLIHLDEAGTGLQRATVVAIFGLLASEDHRQPRTLGPQDCGCRQEPLNASHHNQEKKSYYVFSQMYSIFYVDVSFNIL